MTRRKQRRQKPINFDEKVTLRLGADESAAVTELQVAIAKLRGVPAEKVSRSYAIRLLLTENAKAARILAGQPEKLVTTSSKLDLTDEAWSALTRCENRLAHAQGSAYNLSRKLNFQEHVTRDEFLDAFEAIQDAKQVVIEMIDALNEFVESHQED